ncbi:MAG TPA: SGNH/GDSL hydrolase family protein [Planctomycetota bacterium]|nr:SGNH/GDSL hydrolase family protein [Planctomycetota bacterium]HRR82980.1 SGNH/GDSL hydrolase family protein [Planctomycetota bacterium]HRT94597.1 SGNH/GDSL hydrolase family protein [Planctomycetota bacterium]
MPGYPHIMLVIAAAVVVACAPRGSCPEPSQRMLRIVCLGDSITDGCTYPQLLVQALRAAGRPAPVVICAGVASDTAPQMAARVEKTVLVFRPTLVTFCAGTNDALRGVPPTEYEKALREVSAKVKAQGGSMVLVTPCIINAGKGVDAAAQARAAAADAALGQYIEVIRKVAADEGYPVAENNTLMQAARREGRELMADDGIHPNYLGQSLIARSILDALGHHDVPLPREFRPALFPGVVREWKMRLAPLDAHQKPQRLTEAVVRQLAPDASWKTYHLPDPPPASQPSAEDWWEQVRRNGFGLRVHQVAGKGLVQAVAAIECARARDAFVNTGIGIATVWLNGVKLHDQGTAWTGFHAGKERLPANLRRGRNEIVVEIDGPQFFLSVTDKLAWEEDLRFEAGSE